jgi:putative transposase
MNSQGYATDLSDEQWARLGPLLGKPTGRPPKADRRRVVDGILYLLRTGCQWRLLPKDFPAWSTVHSAYRRWYLDGTLERVHEALRQEVRRKAGREIAPRIGVIDSQSVKTTEKGGRAATTRPRG